MENTYAVELTKHEIIALIGAAYFANNIIGGFDDAVKVAAKLHEAICPQANNEQTH